MSLLHSSAEIARRVGEVVGVVRLPFGCAGLRPPLAARLLRLRAVAQLQRWWRAWLAAERLRALTLTRARVRMVTTNRLYMPTARLELLAGRSKLNSRAQ